MADIRQISWFERLQYSTTKVIAVLVALVAWIAIAGAVAYLVLEATKSPAYVSQAEVRGGSAPVVSGSGPATTAPSGPGAYTMPANLKDFFSGANKEVLESWLEDLSVAQQQDFLDNLSQVVISTPSDSLATTANRYKELKLAKLKSSPFDRYEKLGQQAAAATAIIAALFLIILSSLVLLLLGIERNTRAQSGLS